MQHDKAVTLAAFPKFYIKSVLLRGKTVIIYKATNLLNGKIYIGQTVRSLEERVQEHMRHKKSVFDKALAKYGIDNFEIAIIDNAETIDELNEKEAYWIKYYNSFSENGYNMCEGGGNTKGYHHKDISKKAMSEKKKVAYIGEGNPFYGKYHSEATRKRFSETRKGRKLTEEWKIHISEGSICKRKVKNIETNEIFDSIKEAAEKYNIKATHITRVCRGKRKKTGGFHWEYI